MATFDERFILPTQLPELEDNRLFKDFQVTPGTKIGNILTGNNGEERYQTWPERMVRSGLALPADVYEGREAIIDPTTGHTAQPVIERTQDLAGLAGMSTIGIKPGTASVASAIVREDSKPATALAALNNHVNEMKAKYGNDKLWETKLDDNEFNKLVDLDLKVTDKAKQFGLTKEEYVASEAPTPAPIKLDNGLTLVPVRHNPFAELETGIREAAKNIIRDEPLPSNTATQNLINKRIELYKKQLEHVKNFEEENTIYDKIRDLRDKRRETEGHDSPTTNEFSKITDYALEYADRINPKGREKRAAVQGFEDTAYHGAKDEWRNLEVIAPKDYGFYSTANPELANMYAGEINTWSKKNVMPLKINTNEYLTVNAEGKSWTKVNEEAIAKANKEGKKGVVIHNVYDEPSSGQQLGAPKTVYIALDPTTVRSKFAKFNPENIGKNGLLFEDSKVGTAIGSDGQEKKLVPISHNPFKMTPVDYNPFENAL